MYLITCVVISIDGLKYKATCFEVTTKYLSEHILPPENVKPASF